MTETLDVRSISRAYPLPLRLMLLTERQGDCCVWLGAKDDDGYGRVRVDGRAAQRLTHIVWELAHGRSVPPGQVVRHRCDNPPCVDPRHLLLGTPQDNVRDRDERGRTTQGEAHYAHRLTAADVREIRRRTTAGESVTAIAREFGVRPWSVQKIRDRQTWKYVQ